MLNIRNTYTLALEDFPRAKKQLEEWYFQQWKNNQMGLVKESGGSIEEANELLNNLKEQIILHMGEFFTYNCRDLYEFFDENEVYIEVQPDTSYKYAPWVNDNMVSDSHYNTRFEAEKVAFNRAFDVLEKKLITA